MENIDTWECVHNALTNKFTNETQPQILQLFQKYQNNVPLNIINTIFLYLAPKLQQSKPKWHIRADLPLAPMLKINCSKYGGYPYLTNDENWPQCNQRKNCKRKLYLFLQINMNDLPSEFTTQYLPFSHKYKDHLLQLFHCLNPECMIFEGEGFSSHSKIHLTRFIKFNENNQKDTKYLKQQMDIIKNEFEIRKSKPTRYDFYFQSFRFKECEIFFSKGSNDNPYWAEYATINSGIFASKYWPKNVVDFTDHQYPEGGDKIGGYFNWRQPDAIYPTCSICGFDMNIAFCQLTGYSFGWEFTRGGNSLLSICPNHPFEVAFQTTF